MRPKKPLNPNVFVRAFEVGGFDVHEMKNGWTILVKPSAPGITLAVPMNHPLQAEKIESYLRSANLSEETFEEWITKALKSPTT